MCGRAEHKANTCMTKHDVLLSPVEAAGAEVFLVASTCSRAANSVGLVEAVDTFCGWVMLGVLMR